MVEDEGQYATVLKGQEETSTRRIQKTQFPFNSNTSNHPSPSNVFQRIILHFAIRE